MDSRAGSKEGQGSLVCEQTVVLCVGKYHCESSRIRSSNSLKHELAFFSNIKFIFTFP